jgi:hypothetical protein
MQNGVQGQTTPAIGARAAHNEKKGHKHSSHQYPPHSTFTHRQLTLPRRPQTLLRPAPQTASILSARVVSHHSYLPLSYHETYSKSNDPSLGSSVQQCEKYRQSGYTPCFFALAQVKETSTGESYRGGSRPARQAVSYSHTSSPRLTSNVPLLRRRFLVGYWEPPLVRVVY